MKNLLLASALVFSMPVLASAAPMSVWDNAVESISAADDCGLISDAQSQAAYSSLGVAMGFGNDTPPKIYMTHARNDMQRGIADANTPNFCGNYDLPRLNLIRQMAADYGSN
jgi:hypothetical protein